MKSPFQRARRGIAVLAVIVILGVLGYRMAGYGWLEALWMVVITIASVGYGERSAATPAVQILTICVIVFGISAAFYTFGGMLETILEGELNQFLGHTRRTRDIEKLNEHVIICGFGRIGQILAAELARQDTNFVVIDQDTSRTSDAAQREYLFLEGDATSDDVLIAAGIGRAKVLVTALPNDAANVFITLTGRNLNAHCFIVARAEHRSSERKLLQAGANRVVMPAASGAKQMARLITRPSTADLVELVAESTQLDVDLDEMEVVGASALVGHTIRDTEAHSRYHLLIVAVKQSNGAMEFSPDAEFRFAAGQVVILMGRHADIEQFRREFGGPQTTMKR